MNQALLLVLACFISDIQTNPGIRQVWPRMKHSCVYTQYLVRDHGAILVVGRDILSCFQSHLIGLEEQLVADWWTRLQIPLKPFTSNALTHSHWHVINDLNVRPQSSWIISHYVTNLCLICVCIFSSPKTSCWPVPDLWGIFVLWTLACPDAWTTSQKSGRSWVPQSMWVSPAFSPEI